MLLLATGCKSADPESSSPPSAPSTPPASSQLPAIDEHAATGVHRVRLGDAVVTRTNRVRLSRDRHRLKTDTTLARIACRHNQDMLSHGYLGHEDTDGQLPPDRGGREHRRLIGTMGENVYETDSPPQETSRDGRDRWAERVVDAWTDSRGHRENLLRPQFTHVGVCVTKERGRVKATQLLASAWGYLQHPLPWRASPGDSLAVAVLPVKGREAPVRYAFVPVATPVGQALGTKARRFEGALRVPDVAGVYESRFAFPREARRPIVVPGPRVRVDPEVE